MTQENNLGQEKKLYSPIKVSFLGNISELTQAGGFSGAGGPSMMMMMGGKGMGGKGMGGMMAS